jgi:hypothetical protein
VVNETSKFAMPKGFANGQPCKFQFHEIINVTSNDNEIDAGFLPVYGAGDILLCSGYNSHDKSEGRRLGHPTCP